MSSQRSRRGVARISGGHGDGLGRWWPVAQSAMRPYQVIFPPPARDRNPDLLRSIEDLPFEQLIPPLPGSMSSVLAPIRSHHSRIAVALNPSGASRAIRPGPINQGRILESRCYRIGLLSTILLKPTALPLAPKIAKMIWIWEDFGSVTSFGSYQLAAVSRNVSDLPPNAGKITEGSSGLNNHGGVAPVGRTMVWPDENRSHCKSGGRIPARSSRLARIIEPAGCQGFPGSDLLD